MKPENWLETLNCAVEGVLHAVQSQRHMRWHLVAGAGVVGFALALPVTPVEFSLLCLSVSLVLAAELLNTAMEAVVDLASPQFHDLARVAKDVAAGAVLVAALGAAAVGWVVLFPKISSGASRSLDAFGRNEPVGLAAVALGVLLLVVLLKAIVGRGTPLHGGFPSGHAAVSFAIATILTLRSLDPLVAFFAGTLALMVSHSRLLLRVHSWFEVLVGACLGVAASSLLYWWIF